MTTLIELAAHVKEMRDLQTAYFASKKENRWGDKKLLAASKAKEAEVDGLVREVLKFDMNIGLKFEYIVKEEEKDFFDKLQEGGGHA